ncbi:hypothetical protein [Actinacidiphila oryziradicis]|uniref:Uncharacterized protein n=1 Tax=Actinacidiphila oryziradicis TaxID=2571141 RepID=A0A4U0SWK8_9ACTN|nr:hypothetical protein [Actinacidiphila oryziradicis]TKA04905.1 hypothetical protein FCI23_34065 [Actinacidiphila oryziradicis]
MTVTVPHAVRTRREEHLRCLHRGECGGVWGDYRRRGTSLLGRSGADRNLAEEGPGADGEFGLGYWHTQRSWVCDGSCGNRVSGCKLRLGRCSRGWDWPPGWPVSNHAGDDMAARTSRPSGPFPYLDDAEDRERFVQAGLLDERCTLDEGALRRLATELVHTDRLIQTEGKGKSAPVTGFRTSFVEPVETEHGTLYQLRARQPGLAGAINQLNIRFTFDVVRAGNLPMPVVRSANTETGQPLAVVDVAFDSESALLKHLEFVEGRLEAAEAARPYDLRADLEAAGQSERAVYHMVRYSAGGECWYVPAATAGSNRTRHRHDLFGLAPAAGILGLGQDALDGEAGRRWRDPAAWRDAYTARLNTYNGQDPDSIGDAAGREWARRAAQARRVAAVDTAFVIGFDPAGAAHPDFGAALAATNLRTHLRGPLEFSPDNQALSHGRSLVDAAYAAGDISDVQRDVLLGALPGAELESKHREMVATLVRFVDGLIYPADADGQARIRKVMVEPAPSRLGKKHAEARERVRVALLTAAIGGVDLPVPAMDTPTPKELRTGLTFSGRPVADLVADSCAAEPSEARTLARKELAHLAVPGLVQGRVLLGSYGSTGDRRTPKTKLDAAAATDSGVRLFVEAIDMLDELMVDRADGTGVVREGADLGRLRTVNAHGPLPEGEKASSTWFTTTWPDPSTLPPGVGDGLPSQASAQERWDAAVRDLSGKRGRANEGLRLLVKHMQTMEQLVGPGRGLSGAEREEFSEDLDAMEELVEEAARLLRKLKAKPPVGSGDRTSGTADDFTFPETGNSA